MEKQLIFFGFEACICNLCSKNDVLALFFIFL